MHWKRVAENLLLVSCNGRTITVHMRTEKDIRKYIIDNYEDGSAERRVKSPWYAVKVIKEKLNEERF